MRFGCSLEHGPEGREGAQRGGRQEQGAADPWLSPSMLGDTASPLHNPDNCSISHSAAGQKSVFGSC